ncbi:FG-GAP-like repeat-containing protein [Nocardioides ferulae]|uniref:FG-GAP-like repeat-containing protein n=1 Tax=Nocardioides ferulae TaxID=2340821 RepID=UPI000F894A55|nr:FG-GAP-like repeat-containing protein [Nocardioides ferulae]
MPVVKARFITACQQLLALGVVVAGLTPAATIVSLDVVHQQPAELGELQVGGALAAYSRVNGGAAEVPAERVDAEVTEYSLTSPAATVGRRTVPDVQARRSRGTAPGTTEITSRPQPVSGYGAVGLTWAPGTELGDEEAAFEVRTRDGDAWSGWMPLEYHDEHAPDPGTPEARGARPGTDPLFVGHVEEVQVRASTETVPADLRMAVIDPGTPERTVVARPAIDTAALESESAGRGATAAAEGEASDEDDAIALQAASYTEKPEIFSRAQWGANESLRQKSSLSYYEVHAGFVHHTVNANDYTRAEVPGILRSIYAYHTQSRGWSDVGYNFLVDRFGRIWEGRYGGVDRPVVGAHTLGYNENSFAMSAIGNFETVQPTAAMLEAYGALFAWKLSLHGVDAASSKQWVGSRNFPAINGHRDAASTACPGRHLYARLDRIRELAAQTQRGWEGRELQSDVAGSPHPDLLVRRASDGQGFVIPTGGLTSFRKPALVSTGWASATTLVAAPDLTGDGLADLVAGGADGIAVHPGTTGGGFDPALRHSPAFADHDLLTSVGDLDGDGRGDLVARHTSGRLDLYRGVRNGAFDRSPLSTGWEGYDLLVGPGDVDGDGRADLLARDTQGRLWLHAGGDAGTFDAPVEVPGRWGGFDVLTGYGDYTGDGHADLFVRSEGGKGAVLPGRGDGTFARAVGTVGRVRNAPVVLGAGQLTGDPAPDLLVRRGDRLLRLENSGGTELGAPIPMGIRLRAANLLLNVGDWDRDGDGDMVLRNRQGALMLRPGDGTGAFGKAQRLGTGFGKVDLLAAVGDMTGDGWPDLMGQPQGGSMRIYPGNGGDGLGESYVAHSAISAQRQIGIGRWDGDGAPDSLFRTGGKLTLYRGNGPGGLTTGTQLSADLTRYDWVVGVSGVRLQGPADLLVRARGTGELWLLEPSGEGFAKPRYLGEGMDQYDLAG